MHPSALIPLISVLILFPPSPGSAEFSVEPVAVNLDFPVSLGGRKIGVVRVEDGVYKHPEGIVDLKQGPDERLYFTTASGISRLVYAPGN